MTDQLHPNIPLLRKAVEHCEQHPEEHNQWTAGWRSVLPSASSFGTRAQARCVGGWALHFAGYTWSPDNPGQLYDPEGCLLTTSDGYHECRRLLGLTTEQAEGLFVGDLTIKDIRRNAEKIAASVGERL